MSTGAPLLEVGEERLWCEVCVERFWVPKFLHPRILDDGEDKLRSLATRRLVGAAVGALGLVRPFRARAYDGCGIVIDGRVVGSDAFCFGKIRAIARCVGCHRPNEVDQVVSSLCFVVRHLEEDRCQDLPHLREVGV